MQSSFLSRPRDVVGLSLACACAVSACGGGSAGGNSEAATAAVSATVPGAPTAIAATAGNASGNIAFTAPLADGGSAITGYIATCAAGGVSNTAVATASPINVSGLSNGTAYSCAVRASNAVGTGAASVAAALMPAASSSNGSLNAVYRKVAWQAGVTVSFPTDCTMTFTSTGTPSHALSTYYLEPANSVYVGTAVANTPGSNMRLGVAGYTARTATMSETFNTCPTKAATTTVTTGGPIGWMISGASLFNATEGMNTTTPALSDNVSYTFTDSAGVSQTAKFIDSCNGHPTPATSPDPTSTYHYHGVPACVTALVDSDSGASHIIGIANDGFPIYGGRDISGNPVTVDKLDACNGITSATPEFPAGIYHYVLPEGVTSFRSSMACYTGAVSRQMVAAAAMANGICYGGQAPSGRAGVLGTLFVADRSTRIKPGKTGV